MLPTALLRLKVLDDARSLRRFFPSSKKFFVVVSARVRERSARRRPLLSVSFFPIRVFVRHSPAAQRTTTVTTTTGGRQSSSLPRDDERPHHLFLYFSFERARGSAPKNFRAVTQSARFRLIAIFFFPKRRGFKKRFNPVCNPKQCNPKQFFIQFFGGGGVLESKKKKSRHSLERLRVWDR
jgi:hypothetical protein